MKKILKIILLLLSVSLFMISCEEKNTPKYNNAARRFHDILLGNNHMTDKERVQTYLEEYNTTCDILRKYIII